MLKKQSKRARNEKVQGKKSKKLKKEQAKARKRLKVQKISKRKRDIESRENRISNILYV